MPEHRRDVAARFRIRRDCIVVLLHRAFAGVVGRQDQVEAHFIAVEQRAQVAGTGAQVVGYPGRVGDAMALRRRRHELHETDRALRRHGRRTVGGLDRDDRVHQRGVDPGCASGHPDLAGKRLVRQGRRCDRCDRAHPRFRAGEAVPRVALVGLGGRAGHAFDGDARNACTARMGGSVGLCEAGQGRGDRKYKRAGDGGAAKRNCRCG